MDPFKWTIQPSSGAFYWTEANLNKNVAVSGDSFGAGKPLVLVPFTDDAITHKWKTVSI
jgi:hypothetical protein